MQRWCGVGAGLLLALTLVNRSGDPGQYGGGGVCLSMRSAAGHQASATGPTGSPCRAVPSGRWRVAKACRRSRIRAALEQQQNPIFFDFCRPCQRLHPLHPRLYGCTPRRPPSPLRGRRATAVACVAWRSLARWVCWFRGGARGPAWPCAGATPTGATCAEWWSIRAVLPAGRIPGLCAGWGSWPGAGSLRGQGVMPMCWRTSLQNEAACRVRVAALSAPGSPTPVSGAAPDPAGVAPAHSPGCQTASAGNRGLRDQS